MNVAVVASLNNLHSYGTPTVGCVKYTGDAVHVVPEEKYPTYILHRVDVVCNCITVLADHWNGTWVATTPSIVILYSKNAVPEIDDGVATAA